MTDNPGGVPPPAIAVPDVSANVRAEVAGQRLLDTAVRGQLAERCGVVISSTTWAERMRDPGGWRWRELAGLSQVLGVPTASLVVATMPAPPLSVPPSWRADG